MSRTNDEVETLSEVIRDFLLKAPGCEIDLTIANLPEDVFDRAPGSAAGDYAKVERFGHHTITYAKRGW